MPPMMTIKIKPIRRAGNRKQASPAADVAVLADEGAQVLAPTVRRGAVMPAATHQYVIGEKLVMRPGGTVIARVGSACKVVALLPYEGRGSLLYRVRSDAEQYDRVVAEIDLARG